MRHKPSQIARASSRASLAFRPVPGFRRWEDGAAAVVVALGFFLRVWQPESTLFQGDSAGIAYIAHSIASGPRFPVTDISSSIGSFTPPAPAYVYMLPILLGGPMLGAAFTGMLGASAIALTYLICRRYFTPTIGIIACLLFAVVSGPVTYSRFIWQPNLQTPLVVWLVALLFGAVAGRQAGWLAWALPVWGLLVQAHPVTAALLPLLACAWVLAPETVRRRDVVVGSVVLAMLFVPTAIFEIATHLYDVQVYRGLAASPAIISGSVFRQFFAITALPQGISGSTTGAYRFTALAWNSLLATGLVYVALRVVFPVVRTLASRRAVQPTRHEAVPAIVGWARASEQNRWRVDLVLLAWPSLLLAAQVRHSSPVEIHYVIATYPAQFLAVAILVVDVGRWVAHGRLYQRTLAVTFTTACAVLLLAVCFAQFVGDLRNFALPSTESVGAEQRDLTTAQDLVRKYHVGLVVFQPGYWSVESVRYMLATHYHYDAHVQVLESGACLVGASTDNEPVLYLMSGPVSNWEAILRGTPHVRDLLAGSPTGGYFRAYVVSSAQITGQLVRTAATPSSGDSALFGNELALEHVWRTTAAGSVPGALVLQSRVLDSPGGQPYHQMLGYDITARNRSGAIVGSGGMSCNAATWERGQRIYFMVPQVAGTALTDSGSLTIGAHLFTFGETDPTLGPVRLSTAFDLTTMQYFTKVTAVQALAATHCATTATCLANGRAMFPTSPP